MYYVCTQAISICCYSHLSSSLYGLCVLYALRDIIMPVAVLYIVHIQKFIAFWGVNISTFDPFTAMRLRRKTKTKTNHQQKEIDSRCLLLQKANEESLVIERIQNLIINLIRYFK